MDNDNKEPQSLFDKYKESVHNSRKEEYPNFFYNGSVVKTKI